MKFLIFITRIWRKFFVKPIIFNRTFAVFRINQDNDLIWCAGNFWFLFEAKKFQKTCRFPTIICKIYND